MNRMSKATALPRVVDVMLKGDREMSEDEIRGIIRYAEQNGDDTTRWMAMGALDEQEVRR